MSYFQTEFSGQNCLVTGGAGFIGSSLVKELKQLGANVKVIDNLSVGKENLKLITAAGAEFYKLDICDYDKLGPIFENTDIVFHLAAMNRAQRSIDNPIKSNLVNVNGTLNCLDLSKKNGVKKFIFISSSSVYKGVKGKLLKEDMMLEPPHPYGVGKLAGEHYCRLYQDLFDLDTTILRYFSVYGPRQRGDIEYAGVIAKFFLQAEKGIDITIYGNGKQKRNFSLIKDVVKGTVMAAANENTNGKIINIAAEKEVSVLDIAEKIIQLTGSSSKIIHLDALKGDPKRNPADVRVAGVLLGFSADYNIDEGLKYVYENL